MIVRFLRRILPGKPEFKPEEDEFTVFLSQQKQAADREAQRWDQSVQQRSQDPVTRSVFGLPAPRHREASE